MWWSTPEPGRRIWQAPWNNWNDNCIQTEVLPTKHGNTDQTKGHVMRAMRKRIASRWQAHTTSPAQSERTHHSTRRCHANRFASRTTPSGGYENIVTARDVFSRYLYPYLISSQDATTIARVIINIKTKRAFLPTTIFSDKGSMFMSQVIQEVNDVPGITLQ